MTYRGKEVTHAWFMYLAKQYPGKVYLSMENGQLTIVVEE